MNSLWNDKEAAQCKDELALRVYSSRLLGRNPDLVLHGGGNTSVKITEKNILGQEEELLYVKGSGWDLATIEAAGFPAVKLDHLVALSKLNSLSDPQMVNELKTHMTSASAPTPSVEAILHAILPFKYVDHTHADAVVTVTNTPTGLERIKQIYGQRVVIVPYIMPGFDLAGVCAKEFEKQRNDKTIGMVLMNHGIFSFADDAKTSYQRMIELVSMAEDYLKSNKAWQLDIRKSGRTTDSETVIKIAGLRKQLSVAKQNPMILTTTTNDEVDTFLARDDLDVISQQGPATPDHVIRTKQLPMLGNNLEQYISNYKKYFDTHSPNVKTPVTMLDPVPRVILDQDLGMCTLGDNITGANIVRDIYQHTIEIIQRSTLLDKFQALPSQEIFEVEYWDLEQAKLKKGGNKPEFTGEVALVTGAASGIGKACVDSLLSRGAAVVGLDINPAITTVYKTESFLGIRCDVTEQDSISDALQQTVLKYGGLDILILNAGIFPASETIEGLDKTNWDRTLDINLSANLILMQKSYPLLKLAPRYGRVVVIGSKNVHAPGPGASAYSVSKAALNQLTRVASLEWGVDNIRINTLHPNAVFDTGIWSEEILQSRAESYGMSVEEYKARNVLKTEVTSHDVAELAAELCGPLFAKTTAAQIPIDGGDVRVI
jgi:rhamnose utilization protein RhaD (predicted bifunctional aldolase and dehydrogenase)/NAD(P)-dependent dehydrogenase (short-subunit alcohol dehydrogenase family)